MSDLSRPKAAPSPSKSGEYLLVWNDTVRPRRLAMGVGIGVLCALVGLYGGQALAGVLPIGPELVDVLPLLTGIVACLAAGIVTAVLFRPARVVTEETHGFDQIADEVDDMASEPRGLGTLEDASALSRSELEEAGLTEVFRAAETKDAEKKAALNKEAGL